MIIHLTRYCFRYCSTVSRTKSIIALILARVSLTRMKKIQPLSLLSPQLRELFSIIALEYPEAPRKNREIRNAVLKLVALDSKAQKCYPLKLLINVMNLGISGFNLRYENGKSN